MFEKFVTWFNRNRRPIGYTLGALNILGGLQHAYNGDFGLAVIWLLIGSFLIADARGEV